MLKVHNFNFYAGSDISANSLVHIDTSHSDSQHICIAPAESLDCIGVVTHDVSEGDAVDCFVPFAVGQVITVFAGGSISAGDYLLADNGDVVSAGEGTNGNLPLVAIDDASSGDTLRACCTVFNKPAASDDA